jgi:hypothetical protein
VLLSSCPGRSQTQRLAAQIEISSRNIIHWVVVGVRLIRFGPIRYNLFMLSYVQAR